MAGCLPTAGLRRELTLPSPSPAAAVGHEEGSSTSAASTSVGTGSPPSSSSASTSSPAFLDDLDPPLYLDDVEAEADAGGLSTAIASRRLFFESPGRSNSIVDSAEHPAAAVVPRGNGGASTSSSSSGRPAAAPTRAAAAAAAATSKGVRVCGDEQARPVPVSTAAPREEFLKSMTEMVDAMGLDVARRGGDRARLHELLLSYIALNDRDALPDILGAFTDLLLALNAHGPAAAPADAVVRERGGGGDARRKA
uniref:Transcription repressor n=1 Tax=Oryza glumipatula TaxID=40148 RepID=A0A0E0BAU1_9ORYZ